MPPVTCLLGGTVCAVAGMLPDLDSGPGVPMRESVAFAAAIAPMLLPSSPRHLRPPQRRAPSLVAF
jgi:hypothetical protein